MHAPRPAPHAAGDRSARIAWLVSFAITLAVIAILLFAKSAQAGSLEVGHAVGGALATVALADDEGEDELEEASEYEEDEESEEEPEEAGVSSEPPAECGLRTARASVVLDESQAKLRTLISYTSFEPVRASIEFRLNGGKGSLTLGRERKRLSYSGVVHGVERLGKTELAKALAARNFTVTVRVLAAPAYCHRYFDRHLKNRRLSGDRITWLQSDSVFGG